MTCTPSKPCIDKDWCEDMRPCKYEAKPASNPTDKRVPAVEAVVGPDHLVKIDDGQSVHVRTASEWLELARRDFQSRASATRAPTCADVIGCPQGQPCLNGWRPMPPEPTQEMRLAANKAFGSDGHSYYSGKVDAFVVGYKAAFAVGASPDSTSVKE